MATQKKIDHLTPEQEARIPEFVDKWLKIGTCTLPADRLEAEKGILQAYKDANLKPPGVVWCQSQLSMSMVRVICQFMHDERAAIISKTLKAELDKLGFKGKLNFSNRELTDEMGKELISLGLPTIGTAVEGVVKDSLATLISSLATVKLTNAELTGVVGSKGKGDMKLFVQAFYNILMPYIKIKEENIRAGIRTAISDAGYGQHDASWLAFYDFFKEVCNLVEETKKLRGLWQIAMNAGWFLPHEDICFIAERHIFISRDAQNNLHNEDRAALEYPDGLKIYAVHGVQVPEYVIIAPETITVEDIEAETNMEVKRVKINQYDRDNLGRYLRDSGAELIDDDPEWGKLYKKDMGRDEAMVMVSVINSTAEPDGTFKDYWIRVDPQLRPMMADGTRGEPQKMTARNAIGSTFGLKGESYAPQLQT